MNPSERSRLAARALAGYVSGPAAATAATRRALRRIPGARAVVLVEGISDQIALETAAVLTGRNLANEGIVALPVGGAHGVGRFVAELGAGGAGLDLAGFCDLQEEWLYRRALERAGYGPIPDRADLEKTGFFVCVDDLEDELIRALGAEEVTAVFASQGDLTSFRTLQKQAAWHDRPVEAQMRRFLGAGARRKSRYARLLTEAAGVAGIPAPLLRCLAAL